MNSAKIRSAAHIDLEFKYLRKAAEDFRYLLNRGYPRKASLELVGNRYELAFDERHILHRGVFSDVDSEARRKKIISIKTLKNKDLAIDGHNVLITIEAGLSGRPLILADDGFVRDISGLSGSFKKTEMTEKGIELIVTFLKKWRPRHTLFLFDAPISKSGILAQELRALLKKESLPGDAMAVKVPEKILIGFPGVIATSDTAIIDQSEKVIDLAGDLIRERIGLKSLPRWKRRRVLKGRVSSEKFTPLESPLLSNGVNSYRPGHLVGIPDRIHDILSLSGITDEIEVA